MKKIITLSAFLFTMQFSFAQKKTYADSLSKAFNTIFSTLPEKCSNLYGTLFKGSDNSYNSTISLPRSIENRIEIDEIGAYPLVYMCYVPAGNDKNKAIVQIKKIDKAIKATVINYKNTKYKIQLIVKESKLGDKPDYQYQLINPPAELANVKIYIRLDDSFGVKTKYKFTMGVYTKRKDE